MTIIPKQIREDQSFCIKFWGYINVKNNDECWNWLKYKNKRGYGVARYKNSIVLAHRIAYFLTYIGGIPQDYMILHTCHNPPCCNPAHLYIGNHEMNTVMMMEAKRQYLGKYPGEGHHNHKLTTEQVLSILSDNRTHREISLDYNVTRQCITEIKRGVAWRHITI